MLISLDFAPGLHGHFLELVINKYIYRVPYYGEIFHSSGAAHRISKNEEYQLTKMVHLSHSSAFGFLYPPDTEKIIFIRHNEELDFVFLANVFYRCHFNSRDEFGVSAAEVAEMHRKFLGPDAESDLLSRKNWFAKLDERLFVAPALARNKTTLPVHDFDYCSFFNFEKFCYELELVAQFLDEEFKFDQSLSKLWQEFIEQNQGWRLYQQSHAIIHAMLMGDNVPIPNNWQLHAYLNFRISRLFKLFNGRLHDDPVYPDNTLELFAVVCESQVTR